MNMARIKYVVCMHEWKSICGLQSQLFFENKDFSRLAPLRTVTYTLIVVVSKKWCMRDTFLLHTTNRKYHMTYPFVPFAVTLDDLEGHSPVAGLI